MARLLVNGKPCLDTDVLYTRDPTGYKVHESTLSDYVEDYGNMPIHITEKETKMPNDSEFNVLIEHCQQYDCHMVTNEDVCIARVSPGLKTVGHVCMDAHRRFRFRNGGICADVGKDFDSNVFMLIEVPLLGTETSKNRVASQLPVDPTRAIEVTIWRITADGSTPKIFRV